MSTTIEPTATDEPTGTTPGAKAAKLATASAYLHLGLGAEDCPDRGEFVSGGWVGDGKCANPDHYHAWLRVPNQFQRNDAREKALAARARRKTVLTTEGTDAYVILEGQLAEVRAAAEGGGDAILKDELVGVHAFTDQVEAYNLVAEREEWAGIDADRERLEILEGELEDNPDTEPTDELTLLRERVTKYHDAILEEERNLREPRMTELDGLSLDELMQRVRDVRVESDALTRFLHVEAWYTWLLSTFETTRNEKGQHRVRKYQSEAALQAEDPEILDDLQMAHQDLTDPIRVRAEGNS